VGLSGSSFRQRKITSDVDYQCSDIKLSAQVLICFWCIAYERLWPPFVNLNLYRLLSTAAAAIFVHKQVTAMKKIFLSALLFTALCASAQKKGHPLPKEWCMA
jgi:hypothetical protein